MRFELNCSYTVGRGDESIVYTMNSLSDEQFVDTIWECFNTLLLCHCSKTLSSERMLECIAMLDVNKMKLIDFELVRLYAYMVSSNCMDGTQPYKLLLKGLENFESMYKQIEVYEPIKYRFDTKEHAMETIGSLSKKCGIPVWFGGGFANDYDILKKSKQNLDIYDILGLAPLSLKLAFIRDNDEFNEFNLIKEKCLNYASDWLKEIKEPLRRMLEYNSEYCRYKYAISCYMVLENRYTFTRFIIKIINAYCYNIDICESIFPAKCVSRQHVVEILDTYSKHRKLYPEYQDIFAHYFVNSDGPILDIHDSYMLPFIVKYAIKLGKSTRNYDCLYSAYILDMFEKIYDSANVEERNTNITKMFWKTIPMCYESTIIKANLGILSILSILPSKIVNCIITVYDINFVLAKWTGKLVVYQNGYEEKYAQFTRDVIECIIDAQFKHTVKMKEIDIELEMV